MTVSPSIDPARLIEEQLAQASPDLLRELLTSFINTLMSAEADAVCGAAYGTSSPERTNRRNGYRGRDFDTRTGTLELEIPKLRTGTYFPEWLLERRKRAERALTSVVATCYLLGVSTRRMDKLVQSLGITTLSKSQVSEMAKDLDGQVEEFRTRSLADAGPFTFVAADALVLKVREGGRVVPVHALVATGVDADGHRQILGIQVTTSEDGADEPDDAVAVGEDADDVGAASDFAVEPFVGVVRPDLSPHFFRERGEGEDVGAGGFEVVGYGGELPGESINDPVELGIHSVGVGLVVHAVQQRFDPRPAALGGG